MLIHPIFIIIPFLAALKTCKGNSLIFRSSGLIMPILTWLFLILGEGTYVIEVGNLKIIWDFDQYSKIIGSAFLIVLFVANSYAIGHKRYKEVVIGSAYCAAALVSIMARDFVSMFVGIELMLISASILIFIGPDKLDTKAKEDGIKTAKKYLLTHLLSGSMILIGIVHIISKNNSSEIVSVTELFDNPIFSKSVLYIMATGFIINIAAFPFSGWMVNYYKKASASGFLYLISFTTKVSIILLLKLFAGFEYLKYVALLMILYSGFKAMFENSIFSLLSYLSIIAMGVMVSVIGYRTNYELLGVVCYLFIHIIYKLCISVFAAIAKDHKGAILCSDIGVMSTKSNLNNNLLLVNLTVAIALMINLPFSLTFYSKLMMTHDLTFKSDILQWITLQIANLFIILALPWKNYIKSDKINIINLNNYTKLAVIVLILASTLAGFTGVLIPSVSLLIKTYEVNSYINDVLKQFAIFFIAFIFLVKKTDFRKSGKALNLLEIIGGVLFHLYSKLWKHKETKTIDQEKWSVVTLEKQLLQKITMLHSQQTAIFMVFVLLIIMIIILL